MPKKDKKSKEKAKKKIANHVRKNYLPRWHSYHEEQSDHPLNDENTLEEPKNK